jgi:anti-anti-sigma factor
MAAVLDVRSMVRDRSDRAPTPPLRTSSVRLRRRREASVVEVHGECDIADAPAIREALASAVADHAGPVVVDLRRSTLVSSAVIATLLNALRRLTRLRRPMVVVARPEIERVFRLARLDDTFQLCPDMDSALRRCASAPSRTDRDDDDQRRVG